MVLPPRVVLKHQLCSFQHLNTSAASIGRCCSSFGPHGLHLLNNRNNSSVLAQPGRVDKRSAMRTLVTILTPEPSCLPSKTATSERVTSAGFQTNRRIRSTARQLALTSVSQPEEQRKDSLCFCSLHDSTWLTLISESQKSTGVVKIQFLGVLGFSFSPQRASPGLN